MLKQKINLIVLILLAIYLFTGCNNQLNLSPQETIEKVTAISQATKDTFSKQDKETVKSFTLDYKNYLQVFILLKIMQGENYQVISAAELGDQAKIIIKLTPKNNVKSYRKKGELKEEPMYVGFKLKKDKNIWKIFNIEISSQKSKV